MSPTLPPLFPFYDSGWFTMDSQGGADSFQERRHYIGSGVDAEYPRVIRVLTNVTDGNNAGFVFEGMGAAMSDDTRNYGGLIYAYDNVTVRLWAPDEADDRANGYIVNIFDGWGGEVNTQRSSSASVRITAQGNCTISYDFDSGWFKMSAQAGTDSFREVSHGLRATPGEVRVLTRAIDGNNKGYIFEAMGMAQSDDDIGNGYGGLVYGYNDDHVRLWAPDENEEERSSTSDGRIVYVGDGWGGEVNTQGSMTAEVRVLARSSVPCGDPDYDSGWFSMSSQAGTDSYREVLHDLGTLPEYVRVLVRADDGNNAGYVFEGMGNAQTDDTSGAYGGVIFGYSDTAVRLWAPDRNNDKYSHGRIVSISDGWGAEINSQLSQTASVRVKAWRTCDRCKEATPAPTVTPAPSAYPTTVPIPPSPKPSPAPSGHPVLQPSPRPTLVPTPRETEVPTPMPDTSPRPSARPSPAPTPEPSPSPTAAPLHGNFTSPWFTMRAQNGSDSFQEFRHYIGSAAGVPLVPEKMQVLVRATDGNNEGFVFHAMGAAMGDDSRYYGGLLFAYSDWTVRLWAPTHNNNFDYGRIVNIFDGWGGEVNTQRSLSADVRFIAQGDCALGYDFDSGWFKMSAQNGTDSFREVPHGLQATPAEVRVLTRAIDGNNKGYIFEAMGMAQSDDDIGNGYGGLVYGYNNTNVRLWAPDKNENEAGSDDVGRIVYVNDGWGGEVNTQVSMTAEVRVLARSSMPCGDPDYDSGWFTIRSQDGTNSYREVLHGLGIEPEYVRVLLRADDGNNDGYFFEGMGNAQTDDTNGAYGGVIFGYSDTAVRIWAPDRNNDKYSHGKMLSISDGWGGELEIQASDSASVRIMAWRTCVLCS